MYNGPVNLFYVLIALFLFICYHLIQFIVSYKDRIGSKRILECGNNIHLFLKDRGYELIESPGQEWEGPLYSTRYTISGPGFSIDEYPGNMWELLQKIKNGFEPTGIKKFKGHYDKPF